MGFEGLVSEHRDRPCQAGRAKHWIKAKNRKQHAFDRAPEAHGRMASSPAILTACLFLLGLAVHVASVGDAFTEELSPLTRDRPIAGLIRRELFVPKHLAFLCHFLRNGPVRLGEGWQQRSSR
jgi:hypothetical protein